MSYLGSLPDVQSGAPGVGVVLHRHGWTIIQRELADGRHLEHEPYIYTSSARVGSDIYIS